MQLLVLVESRFTVLSSAEEIYFVVRLWVATRVVSAIVHVAGYSVLHELT